MAAAGREQSGAFVMLPLALSLPLPTVYGRLLGVSSWKVGSMKRLLRTLLAVSLVAASLSSGTAAARQPDDTRSEHQKTVDFWTADKVRQAIPRDFVFHPASGRFIPAARGGNPGPPGGGGGGGGGDSTTTTGTHWTGEGTVVESTGKVLFSLGTNAQGEDLYWVCSASVVADGEVGRSLAVTAAHCVYENAGGGEFAQNWMYIPNYEEVAKNLHILNDNTQVCTSAPNGCWTANALVLHDGFASAGGFNGTAIQYDFAFAVIGDGGKTNSLVEGLGTQGIAFDSVSKGASTFSFGYPHDFATFNHDLTYCAGGLNFDNRFFKLTYKLKCDMTGGASGGPWFSPFTEGTGAGTVMSVNSYRYSGGDALYGPKFNANTAAIFGAAKLTAGNCIEPTTCPAQP